MDNTKKVEWHDLGSLVRTANGQVDNKSDIDTDIEYVDISNYEIYIGKTIIRYTNTSATSSTGLIECADAIDNAVVTYCDIVGNQAMYSCGYVRVTREFTDGSGNVNNIYNYMDKRKRLISERWFQEINVFKNGFGVVGDFIGYEIKYNYIDINGKFLLDKWYKKVNNFKEYDYAEILISDDIYSVREAKKMLIDRQGKFLFETPYASICKFSSNGFAIVYDGKINRYNFIDKKGKILSKIWFSDVKPFNNKLALVYEKRKGWNFLLKDGTLLSDEWFDKIDDDWRNPEIYFGINEDDVKFVIINANMGCILANNMWFDGYTFATFGDVNDDGGIHEVKKDNKYNYITLRGEFLLKEWVDENCLGSFFDGYARVYIKDKGFNFINVYGRFISTEYFDDVDYFENGKAKVLMHNGKYNYINTEGKLTSETGYETEDCE